MTILPIKWQIERAVFRDYRNDPSRRWVLDRAPLPSSGRLVMSVLLSRADVDTGVITPDNTPSLTELAELTGLNRSTVQRVLSDLEKRGWVVRNRPDPADARAHGERTWYELAIPSPADASEPAASKPRRKPKPATGRGTTPPPETPEVGAQDDEGRGVTHPEVGAQNTMGRCTTPPITSSRPERPSPPPPPAQTRAPLVPVPETGGGGSSPPEKQAPDDHGEAVDAVVESVAQAAGLDDPEQLHAIRPAVAAALARGWPAPALAEHLAADLPEMIRPDKLIGSRLKPDTLPTGPARCTCRGCTRWRRAAAALARAVPPPATCITHKVDIAPGTRCPGCETEAAEVAARQQQTAREESTRRADRQRRVADAREALGLSVVAALTGQWQNPGRPVAGMLLGRWLDDHGWDLDAARAEAARLNARRAS